MPPDPCGKFDPFGTLYHHLTNSASVNIIITLDLTIEGTGHGFEITPYSFDFQPGDRFPSMRSLRISGRYDWDDEDRWRLRRLELGYDNPGYPAWSWLDLVLLRSSGWTIISPPQPTEPAPLKPTGGNIAKWIDAMDWSKLEILEVENPSASFLYATKDELPALQHLKFTFSKDLTTEEHVKFHNALDAFLLSIRRSNLGNTTSTKSFSFISVLNDFDQRDLAREYEFEMRDFELEELRCDKQKMSKFLGETNSEKTPLSEMICSFCLRM